MNPGSDRKDLSKKASCFWLPYTQMKQAGDVPVVVRGDGVLLELEDGRVLVDLISSWWVNIHGHARPELAEAIYRQARKLEQVICAGFTHQGAETLALRLSRLLPGDLQWVFYSDNGSTAVEVALKMAVQYWKNKGEMNRNRFISFKGAYHGDTFGAMSVSDRSVFTEAFSELLFHVDFLEYPYTWIGDTGIGAREEEIIERLESLLRCNPGAYAGLVIEPLVQGAGGMRMCRPRFLRQLSDILSRYGVLCIYDEVMTGFGRTGELFACKKAGTVPDIICLSKGITGGFLPLGVTVSTSEIFSAFYDDDPQKTFFHGHSYTANPLACAAALASIDMLEARPEMYKRIEDWHRQGLERISSHPSLRRPRICGTIAAIDVAVDENGYLSSIGAVLKKRFPEKGLLLRPLGNVIYMIPPYCIERDQLMRAYDVILETLNEVL